jgi:mannose-6-phosphate isomerase-like protein (cupin superfamily)
MTEATHSPQHESTHEALMDVFIGQDNLPGPRGARRFIGADHGGLPISLFLVDDGPGSGPRLHRHPYPELFILHAGQAEFTVDDAVFVAEAGDILIAPAGTAHRFTNTGSEQLRMTAVHTAPEMDTEWLEPDGEPERAGNSEPTNGTPC